MQYKYSVLTYIFNNYEPLREIEEIDEEVEYICVTDDKTLTSNTWKIIYDDELDGLGVFSKCYSVKHNPFKYITTDICVRVDGSFQIHKSLTPIVNAFLNSGDDVCLSLHPLRDCVTDEIYVWCKSREYPTQSAIKQLQFFQHIGYDFTKKGMIESGFAIYKNNKITNDLNLMIRTLLTVLGDENDDNRLDQTIVTMILDRFFPNIKIFGVSRHLICSDYITYCWHGTNKPVPFCEEGMKTKPSLNDKPMVYNDYNFINYHK